MRFSLYCPQDREANHARTHYFRLLSGRHFDVGVYSLDEIVQFPPLQLGAGGVGSATVQTATQQAVWRTWIVEADKYKYKYKYKIYL